MEQQSPIKPHISVVQQGDSLGMPRVRSGTLHHSFVRLAKDAMEVLALDEPDDDVLANIESSKVVHFANADSTGNPLALFGRKPPQDKEDEDDDEDCLWDHVWEYILGDDKVDEPCEDDPTQSRRFRLRFWEGDDETDDDNSTSDEEDCFDEQESKSGFGFKLDSWRGSDDENDSDTESLSTMDGTDASSISQEAMSTEDIEEIKGPTTLLKHCLLTKPKHSAGKKDHNQVDIPMASGAQSSKERSLRQMASMRTRGFTLVKPKKDPKENVPSADESSRSSRVFMILANPKKDSKQQEQEDGDDSTAATVTSLASRLFQVPSDEENGLAKPKRTRRSSRLFTLAKPKNGPIQHKQEESAVDSKESGPAELKWERLSSRLLILAQPNKSTDENDQEIDLIHSEDVPSVEQESDAAEPTWVTRLMILPEKDANVHDQEICLREISGPAETKWASLSSRLVSLTKHKQDDVGHTDDVPSDKEKEAAECKRPMMTLLQFSSKTSKDDVPDDESEQARRKRTIALPRMFSIKRQGKSPSLLEKSGKKDISEDSSGPGLRVTKFISTNLLLGDGGAEPGSSTASLAGSWIDSGAELASSAASVVGSWMGGSSTGTVAGSWMGGLIGENGNEKAAEIPNSIIVKNKLSFAPNLASLKTKMWSPRSSNVVAGDGDRDKETDDERIESDEENDRKMAQLRKRWANIGRQGNSKNKKMSIGIEIRDANGNVVRKLTLQSLHNDDSKIELTDSDASDNIISQGFLSRPEAEKIESWLKEKKRRRRGWYRKQNEQTSQPVIIDVD
jgi:hypothetical protein